MRWRRLCGAMVLLLGTWSYFFSAYTEWQVSHQPTNFGMNAAVVNISLSMGDLQRTLSAASMRIFAGLCIVAAAVLFAADGTRGPNKVSLPEPAFQPTGSSSESIRS